MSRLPPRSVDEFIVALSECQTVDSLFHLYADEMAREGYDNIAFARMGPTLSHGPREVPFANLPETVAKAYLQERMWEHDPVLSASQWSAVPFTWVELMMRRSHSEAARAVMNSGLVHGVQGGLTMPFHGPGGYWDLVSVSMRDRKLLDPERIAFVNVKSYAAVQRYSVLTTEGEVTGPWTALSLPTPAQAADARQLRHPQHGEAVGAIADPECRAIALVDIAWRRYSAGLLQLNRRVPDIIGEDLLQAFMDRGLIEEDADDFRFHFYFRPSAIGQSHLRQCPCVTQWRQEIWNTYVEVHELPED